MSPHAQTPVSHWSEHAAQASNGHAEDPNRIKCVLTAYDDHAYTVGQGEEQAERVKLGLDGWIPIHDPGSPFVVGVGEQSKQKFASPWTAPQVFGYSLKGRLK